MTVDLIHMPAFTIIGFSKEIMKAEGSKECPEFWNSIIRKKFKKALETGKARNELEQAVLDNKIGQLALTVDGGISFDYTIGGKYNGGPVPEGLTLHQIPEHDWIYFEENGPLPQSLVSLYDYVWGEWFPSQHEFEMADNLDIGLYPILDWNKPDYKSYLCLPVRKIS